MLLHCSYLCIFGYWCDCGPLHIVTAHFRFFCKLPMSSLHFSLWCLSFFLIDLHELIILSLCHVITWIERKSFIEVGNF